MFAGRLAHFALISIVFSQSALALGVRHTPVRDPVRLTFVLTNDLHGHLTADLSCFGSTVGRLRNQPEYRTGQSALIVLDGGDQFQGTLLSNHDEGRSMFKAMNEIGYDAVVPGNHDYDFGPAGWLFDRVVPGRTSNNPREVIEELSRLADFPLLSANTYLKSSIRAGGRPIALDSECKPSNATPMQAPDFSLAERPRFLKPHVILNRAGVRIAVIGLDNHATANTTTKENVSDLCFRDEAETYLEVRRNLEGKADVFVALMHNGNTDKSSEASGITRRILSVIPDGVHLVAAGHTHAIHDHEVEGIHIVQDGAYAKAHGLVDLVYDPTSKKIVKDRTRVSAGILNNGSSCTDFHPGVDRIIRQASRKVEPLAKIRVAEASQKLWTSRSEESPLANHLTDALRSLSAADVALLNTGGIRAPLEPGVILYENLFEVLPFQNQAVVMPALEWRILKAALTAAVQTCGKYGSLMQSGLKIRFERDCTRAKDGIDPAARLLRVETLEGLVLLDSETGAEVAPHRTLSVATIDYLASGGSGYGMLAGATVARNLGILRELISDEWRNARPILGDKIDGRFVNVGTK
jgi:2',3'-cyclic-nucleotide 2'-phosphodiesterase (5'-nucleotidase family)